MNPSTITSSRAFCAIGIARKNSRLTFGRSTSAFQRQVQLEVKDIRLALGAGSGFSQSNGPKELRAPKIVYELHDVVIGQGPSVQFHLVALDGHGHEPEFERVQALAHEIHHPDRPSPGLFKLVD